MLLLMSAIVASTLSDPAPRGPLCVAPPKDASETCVKCYEDACRQYILEWYGCNGLIDCLGVVRTIYFVRLAACECDAHQSIITEALNPGQAEAFQSLLSQWGQ